MKKNKKFFGILLSGIFLILSACNIGNNNQETAIIWSALSTDKYMQNAVLESYPEAKLDYVGMKGETTALQVMITAKEDIDSFNLKVSDLKTENGEVFSKDNLKVYAERYIEVYYPYENKANRGGITYYADAGFYPDALVPIDRYIANREARVEKGNNQGIWVDCVIPSNAVAGNYTGTFTLEYGEKIKEIPVTLSVYDLTMPEEVHSLSLFSIWYEELSKGEKDNYTATTDDVYYEYLLSKRLCAKGVAPKYQKDQTTFINYVAENCENPKVTSYSVPEKFLGANKAIYAPAPADEAKYSQSQRLQEMDKLQVGFKNLILDFLAKNIELREAGNEDIDLFKKLFFSTEDEPSRNTQYRIDRIRIFGERLTAAKKEIIAEKADVWEVHPDLKVSIERLTQFCASNIVESEDGILAVSSKNGEGEPYQPDYEKGDGLTLWCPEQFKFKDKTFRDIVKERQSYGERFLWYNCCETSPFMSYYVETVPVSIRSYSWMQYEYGIEGALYWETVHWSSTAMGDPYQDVSHTNGWGAGEGILLYPGIKYGLKTPVSSIRLEQIFHGQQDYEYLYMLEGYLTQNAMDVNVSEFIATLMSEVYKDGYTVEGAVGADFEPSRIKVLDILQDFANQDVSSAQIKISQIFNK